MFYNSGCVEGAQKHIKDQSVYLIISDPPYGIGGDLLHKHYNRNEEFVLDGYIEVPQDEYDDLRILNTTAGSADDLGPTIKKRDQLEQGRILKSKTKKSKK